MPQRPSPSRAARTAARVNMQPPTTPPPNSASHYPRLSLAGSPLHRSLPPACSAQPPTLGGSREQESSSSTCSGDPPLQAPPFTSETFGLPR